MDLLKEISEQTNNLVQGLDRSKLINYMFIGSFIFFVVSGWISSRSRQPVNRTAYTIALIMFVIGLIGNGFTIKSLVDQTKGVADSASQIVQQYGGQAVDEGVKLVDEATKDVNIKQSQ